VNVQEVVSIPVRGSFDVVRLLEVFVVVDCVDDLPMRVVGDGSQEWVDSPSYYSPTV
jgi:hypothetical protein